LDDPNYKVNQDQEIYQDPLPNHTPDKKGKEKENKKESKSRHDSSSSLKEEEEGESSPKPSQNITHYK